MKDIRSCYWTIYKYKLTSNKSVGSKLRFIVAPAKFDLKALDYVAYLEEVCQVLGLGFRFKKHFVQPASNRWPWLKVQQIVAHHRPCSNLFDCRIERNCFLASCLLLQAIFSFVHDRRRCCIIWRWINRVRSIITVVVFISSNCRRLWWQASCCNRIWISCAQALLHNWALQNFVLGDESFVEITLVKRSITALWRFAWLWWRSQRFSFHWHLWLFACVDGEIRYVLQNDASVAIVQR